MDYGMAEDTIAESYVFVLPSSSGTDKSLTFEQKLAWYQKLKGVVKTL
jgi:G:T/U-mismatch repair DNA glycosylase